MQDNRDKVLQTFNGKSFKKVKKDLALVFPEYKIKVLSEYGDYLKSISTLTNKKEEKHIIIHLGRFQKIATIRFGV